MSEVTFRWAVEIVLAEEAGYVNDPRDPGGETKFGITKRDHPDLDIKTLTREQAVEIYRRDYWTPNHCDDLPPVLALCVFDSVVNMKHKMAGILLQQALDFVEDGRLGQLDSDGVIGPQTLAAVRAAEARSPEYLLAVAKEMLARRAVAYTHLITFAVFGGTWMRRCLTLYGCALRWVAHGATGKE